MASTFSRHTIDFTVLVKALTQTEISLNALSTLKRIIIVVRVSFGSELGAIEVLMQGLTLSPFLLGIFLHHNHRERAGGILSFDNCVEFSFPDIKCSIEKFSSAGMSNSIN